MDVGCYFNSLMSVKTFFLAYYVDNSGESSMSC